MKIFTIAVLCLSLLSGVSYGGYLIGVDHMGKVAISKGFGSLQEGTLAFQWYTTPQCKMSTLPMGEKK